MKDETGAADAHLSRREGVSLWRQIVSILEQEIEDGLTPPGTRLPTEAQLSDRFGVNRHTVRRAIGVLSERGRLRVEQGRGTFVQDEIITYPVTRRTRFSEDIRRQSRSPGGKLLRAEIEAAGNAIAQSLGIELGAGTIVIEKVDLVDDRPIKIVTHYFPRKRFPNLIEAYRQTGSITQALQRHGVDDYFRKSSVVTADLPTGDDARLLEQPSMKPILIVESTNVDDKDRIIEFSVARHSAQRVQIVFSP